MRRPLAESSTGVDIWKLQALRRQVNATTPHALLSQAVDVLRVRPILLRRHRGQAERALANVDLYLSFSRAYAVRGLRAFAEAMTAAWSDEARAVEGRPDAQEEAGGALYHARRQGAGVAHRRAHQHDDAGEGGGERRHRSRQRALLLPCVRGCC